MTKFSLKAYAASAISFLTLHQEVDGQVVYVDIDPDIVLTEGGQAAELDLDQNGTIDFWFHNNSFTFFSESFSSYRLMQNILVGPEIEANFIAGETGEYGTAYGGVYTRYYPFALSGGIKIDANLNFYNYALQVMALRSFRSDGDFNIGDYAFWYNDIIDETTNHYLAFYFNSGEIVNSHGWIRCDVKNEGRTLIIKDYVYETTPDYPIIAGDTLHYVEIIDSLPSNPVTIYSFNETLYINLKDTAMTKITITNLAGQNISAFETNEILNTVDLINVSNGIYIVTAEFKGTFYSTKIIIL
jgi:hypothetical protein